MKKLWNQHCCRVSLPVLILIKNQLKRYLYASMCFSYTGSLLLVWKQIIDNLLVKHFPFVVARTR